VRFFALLWALLLPTVLLARTSLERLETAHLEAVHTQRIEWMKIRAHAAPPPGVYQDYRAILHIHAEDADHTKGTRAEVLKAAKEAEVRVVMFTDHRGPKPETWSGLREGVLFIPGSEDDHLLRYPASPAGSELRFLSHIEERPDMSSAGFQGMEIYNRHTDAVVHKELNQYFQAAMKDPKEWKHIVAKEKEFPDEVFAAGTDALPDFLARWDKELAIHPFTGIAANDAHQNQIFNGTTFDPYAVAFRHVSTHILARNLTEADIRESLAAGRVYLSHDWLCDPTGFSFIAQNNLGIFEMGDQIPLSGIGVGRTSFHTSLPIPAKLKLIRDGEVIAEANDSKFSFSPKEPGVYRLEAWLTIDGEDRPWIFTNPIFVTKTSSLALPEITLASNVEVQRDITYTNGDEADAAKHRLDLYLPKDKKNFPVLVFIHGGSWRSGDRSNYPALGNRFAKLGIGVAIPSYRLMPKNPHPAQIEDTAAAFAWVYKNIAQYGGDANRIYIAGHSAGGHLVALLALDPAWLAKYDIPLTAIRGVAALSGVYDVSKIQGFANVQGDSPSPMAHVHSKAPPFLVSYCQWDYLALPLQARQFAEALKKSFDSVDLLYVPGESHISEIIHIVKDDDVIAQAILKLIQ
jgi:acetyl esterase/lipase